MQLRRQEALWRALEKRGEVTKVPRNLIEGWKFVESGNVSLLKARSGAKPISITGANPVELRYTLIKLLERCSSRGFFFLDEAKTAKEIWKRLENKKVADKFQNELRKTVEALIPLVTRI